MRSDEIQQLALEADVAVGGGLRAVEVAAIVLLGLLACPPLAILVVVVAVPLLVTAVVLGLIGAVLATPYVIVRHVRGHPRIHADARRGDHRRLPAVRGWTVHTASRIRRLARPRA